VDILSGGYPCQPFSAAGKRLGTEDPRHLWPYIANGIRAMRPRVCFFENVEGHISLGLREVVSELEGIGYKVAWGIFSAREVGAPHQRKRVFILGVNNCERLERFNSKLNYPEGRKIQNRPASLPDGTTRPFLSNALRDGSGEGWLIQQGADGAESVSNGESWGAWPSRPGQPQHGWEPPRVVSSTIPNPTDNGLEIDTKRTIEPSEGDRRVSYIGGVCTCEGASMGDPKHNGSHQCGAETRGAESGGEQGWLQESEGGSASVANHLRRGLQDTSNKQRYNGTDNHAGIGTRPTESSRRQTQPPLGGNPHGTTCGMDYAELCVSGDNRTDELRLLGNGVVPATAERAFRTLLAELIP